MLDEFKQFALRGNVVDLAVGVILGAAFGQIVTSLTNDILMPPLGLLLGNIDFSNLFINLGESGYATLQAAQEAGAPTINYGVFINKILDFLIITFAIFLVVRQMNRLVAKKKVEEPAKPPELSTQEKLLTEIRDALTRPSVS